ncbi:MAG: ROK family protein [Tannerella sp.]|jgi:glucokinase|nr:ROK family protein [Tannerella sp.]
MNTNLIGLDIGGTKCAVIYGVTDGESLQIIDKENFPTTDVNTTIQYLLNTTSILMEQYSLNSENTKAIGISCGGPLDSKKGLVMSPPNLKDWNNIPIVRIVSEQFNIPTAIQNDANACALAEWKYGAGKGARNMIFMTYGTGLGAGFILNGQLYSGANDNAGEVGHIRLSDFGPVGYGKSGSFEGFCSGGGIAQLAWNLVYERLQMGQTVSWYEAGHPVTAKMVAEAALKGDELALEIFRTSSVFLGKGLSLLIDILNPELIVLGGIYMRNEALIKPAITEVIQKESLRYAAEVCEIKPAALGENVGDYAALSVAMNMLS